MKRTFRLTALVLALLMLVNISASATTNGIPVENLRIEDWNNMFQSASQAAQNSEDAETVEVDEEEPDFHWGFVTNAANFNDSATSGASLGQIPANSLIKVLLYDASNMVYKVEYNGSIGYISGRFLTECKCENASVTDPATHSADCIYPKYIRQLANEKTAAELYALWAGFTAQEQAFVLAALKDTALTKYAELDALLHPVSEQEKTETTEDGTTVSVSGKMPDNVKLEVVPVSDDVISTYIPASALFNFTHVQLDISLKDTDGNLWQPGESVQVSISANGLGQNGDTIVLFHIHNSVVDPLGKTVVSGGNITFTIDGFSYILGVNVSDDCSSGEECGYAAFENKSIQEKEAALAELYNSSDLNYNYPYEYMMFISHVIAYHPDANLCMCDAYHPDTHGYGTLAHAGYQVGWDKYDCPWAFKSLSVTEQASILQDKTEDERITYIQTITDEAKQKELVNALGASETLMLKVQLAQKYTLDEINAWFSQYTVTAEMVQRALDASSLDSVVLEGALTGYADLYYVRSGQAIAYYQYNADENRGEIIEPSCQLVVAYVVNGVVTPVPEATAAN